MGTRVRSSVVRLAVVVCVCSAARVLGAQAPARQPAVTTDVVYGYKDDGLALMLDVTVWPAPTVLASSPSRAATGNRAWSSPRFSRRPLPR